MSKSAIEGVRAAVDDHFPNLWTAVDLVLSTVATLLLKDATNPTAVNLMGGPSAGKTTVAAMIENAKVRLKPGGLLEPLCYRSDKFTPAAFVSQAANVTATALKRVDLLPKITNKVLLTPELAPIFRGKEDALTDTFSVITRVLDGQGLTTDSGTHGQRGYTGEHVFAWIGCTTPLPDRAWRVMGQLGSRLFFLLLDTSQAATLDDLVRVSAGIPYAEKLRVCRHAAEAFLAHLFERHDGVRSVAWDSAQDDEDARRWLARCATLLAAMRSVPVEEHDNSRRRITYRPGEPEAPHRALAVLTNVARGHALVHDRIAVTMADIPLIVQVTASSMPTDATRVLRALVSSETGTLTVAEAQAVFALRHPESARERMRYADALGAMEFVEPGPGKEATLRFRSQWQWCAAPDFRALLNGTHPVSSLEVCEPPEPISAEGMCVASVTNDLVQRQSERERREADGTPHTPEKATGQQSDETDEPGIAVAA